MSRDSLVSYIENTVNSEVQGLFKNNTLRYLKEFIPSGGFPDNVYSLKLFNSFYYDAKDSSFKNIKYKGISLESYHNNYYGFNPSPEGLEILKNAVSASECDYVLFINKFEIINPNSIFSLHIEVMDTALNRIYGNKNEIKKDISKTMYGDVLKYFIKLSCGNMLDKAGVYLNSR